MSNLSLNESISNNLSVSTQDIPSLDQLLYSLGFTEWGIIASTFVLPALSFVGLLLCALIECLDFLSREIQRSRFLLLSSPLSRLYSTLGT